MFSQPKSKHDISEKNNLKKWPKWEISTTRKEMIIQASTDNKIKLSKQIPLLIKVNKIITEGRHFKSYLILVI